MAPTEPTTKNADGIEVYGSAAMDAALPPLPKAPTPKPTENLKPVSTEYVAEEDDPAVGLERGMRCKRKACSCSWEGESREDEICLYHPGAVSFLSLLCVPASRYYRTDSLNLCSNTPANFP